MAPVDEYSNELGTPNRMQASRSITRTATRKNTIKMNDSGNSYNFSVNKTPAPLSKKKSEQSVGSIPRSQSEIKLATSIKPYHTASNTGFNG